MNYTRCDGRYTSAWVCCVNELRYLSTDKVLGTQHRIFLVGEHGSTNTLPTLLNNPLALCPEPYAPSPNICSTRLRQPSADRKPPLLPLPPH